MPRIIACQHHSCLCVPLTLVLRLYSLTHAAIDRYGIDMTSEFRTQGATQYGTISKSRFNWARVESRKKEVPLKGIGWEMMGGGGQQWDRRRLKHVQR